ncbi:hypothetical protein FQN49_008572, partial [Arthroderma sp. PD_2]
MSGQPPQQDPMEEDREEHSEGEFLDDADAEEVVQVDDDHPMEEDEELLLENDSAAHFDQHSDSLFCIAQHPIHPEIIITGSGDDTAYIFDSSQAAAEKPLLPKSYETTPQPSKERESLPVIAHLDGHKDSVNAVCFTAPRGEYAITAGLDGKLRAWKDTSENQAGKSWQYLAESQEVEEINWIATCPSSKNDDNEQTQNVIAIGASDGSVWVYRVDAREEAPEPLTIVSTFFQHTAACTAGAWTPDGQLLATVSEEGSFYVYDVFGSAAAAGFTSSAGTQSVVALTVQDQRFAVEGGLFSVAISPSGTFAVVGGAEGHIKVVGLPRVSDTSSAKSKSQGKGGAAGSSGG